MPFALFVLAHVVSGARPVVALCRPGQLQLSTDGRDGAFNGMSHSGIALLLRNRGPDCMLPALPRLQLRGPDGRALPAVSREAASVQPQPASFPIRLAAERRAAIDLRWVSGPVYPRGRSIRAASIRVTIGKGTLRAPLIAQLYGQAGRPVTFEQTPARIEK